MGQWELLVQAIKDNGGTVVLVDEKPGLPDMTFLDCGLIIKGFFIPSNFAFSERQGEEPFYHQFF